MKEREFLTVGGLVMLLLILWLGFLAHQSPRFAGSLEGGVLAVAGSALMLVPLVYVVVKRLPPLRRLVTARVQMRTLLAWHIYAGVLGPILVLLHTGHKFVSPLGIALTAMTLIVVVSGFIGRYLLNRISTELHEKQALLTQLNDAFRAVGSELTQGDAGVTKGWMSIWLLRLGTRLVFTARPAQATALPPTDRAVLLAESIADVEAAIRTHATFKAAFSRWLKLHIALSCVLYGLLGLHVWAAIHFGLRWLDGMP